MNGKELADMNWMRRMKRQAKASVPPILFLLVVWYFAWNAVNGDRGLKATAQRMVDLNNANVELTRAEADRDGWQRRVSGLQTDHLDPDTLDERARAMLNMADPADIVVPYTKDHRLF